MIEEIGDKCQGHGRIVPAHQAPPNSAEFAPATQIGELVGTKGRDPANVVWPASSRG
jgi:hypothetical protein